MTGSPTHAEILLRKRRAPPASDKSAKEGDEITLAKAIVRAAHEVLGMRVRVLGASARTETGVEQLTPVFADHALCLAGRGSGGQTGVLALSLEMVAAIIEKSTTGEVSKRAVPERTGTSVDALLSAPVLQAMIENLSLTCAPELRNWIASVELSQKPRRTQDLEFEMSEGSHRILMLRLQFDSVREGELVMLIPQPDANARPGEGLATGEAGPRDRRQTMLGSQTMLSADLASLDVPLSEFRTWQPGSEILIPGDAIGAIEMTQDGGIKLARGRLGQAGGHRAVRLDLPPQKSNTVSTPSVAELEDAHLQQVTASGEVVQSETDLADPIEGQSEVDGDLGASVAG